MAYVIQEVKNTINAFKFVFYKICHPIYHEGGYCSNGFLSSAHDIYSVFILLVLLTLVSMFFSAFFSSYS